MKNSRAALSYLLDAIKFEFKLSETQVNKILKIGAEFEKIYSMNRSNRDKLETIRKHHRNEIDKVFLETA